MQYPFSFCLVFLICLVLVLPVNAQEKESWKLVWSEEFDYKGLPDPEKWIFEVGHVRNMEQQYYTEQRLENAVVKRGKLLITGRKEKFPNAAYEPGSPQWRTSKPYADYTSASITTQGLHAWTYGRIEVRAKLPKGKGMWPAIWMLGDNFEEVGWPYAGEIDIMEHVGKEPLEVHGTVHFPTGKKDEFISNGGVISKKGLARKFHVFAIEWTKEKIDFFVNDILYHSFEIDQAGKGLDNPFRNPHFLIINLAMGANWPGPIDDKVLPQQFIIDYVRVFQKQL
ncbi:glycoside hydrolase family 16 protein [Mongoliitalea daihaiensis]|uniref:glycoside hydrolase family 16 protein n=1 Tax=Mongoliitalea daihaiensis TaxID=2782006 RepID=UPI001F1B9615|nr:glycoside hydrolase family 16 protein [Mongoliitalea daihaiensis]UJP63651.1 glycoside hydrolase family 16 protein [Mongoliitalea daihaiensis]